MLKERKRNHGHLVEARFLKLNVGMRRSQDSPSPASLGAEAQGLVRAGCGSGPLQITEILVGAHSTALSCPRQPLGTWRAARGAFWSPYQKDPKSYGFFCRIKYDLVILGKLFIFSELDFLFFQMETKIHI